MKNKIIISAVFLLINSCSDETVLFDPTYFGEGFKGITFTLQGGPDPIKIDPTDWCYFYPNNGGHGLPLGYSFGAAYPNPTTIDYGTVVRFTLPQDTQAFIYVINYDQEIITVLANTTFYAGVYEIQIDTHRIGLTGVYRVVFESEHFYCKGDIWIKSNN